MTAIDWSWLPLFITVPAALIGGLWFKRHGPHDDPPWYDPEGEE